MYNPPPTGSRRVMWLGDEGSSRWTSWRARAQRAARSKLLLMFAISEDRSNLSKDESAMDFYVLLPAFTVFFFFFFLVVVRRHEFIVNCYSTYSSKMSRTFPVLPAGGMVVPHTMHHVPPCPASDPTHPAWGAVDAASSCLLEVSSLQTLRC